MKVRRAKQDPEARRAYHRDWYRNHPEQLLKKYGITVEQYDALLAAQGGHCALCPATEPGAGRKRWNIDHDHVTGKVRGLLCHFCNLLLGHAHDDPELLERAAVYLRASNLGDTGAAPAGAALIPNKECSHG